MWWLILPGFMDGLMSHFLTKDFHGCASPSFIVQLNTPFRDQHFSSTGHFVANPATHVTNKREEHSASMQKKHENTTVLHEQFRNACPSISRGSQHSAARGGLVRRTSRPPCEPCHSVACVPGCPRLKASPSTSKEVYTHLRISTVALSRHHIATNCCSMCCL